MERCPGTLQKNGNLLQCVRIHTKQSTPPDPGASALSDPRAAWHLANLGTCGAVEREHPAHHFHSTTAPRSLETTLYGLYCTRVYRVYRYCTGHDPFHSLFPKNDFPNN